MRLRKMFQASALILAICTFASAPALAADTAASFIADLGHKALTIIQSTESPAQRRADFSKLFTSDFDVPAIGRFVLGRYWRTATPEQQSRYLDLFGRYVIAIYSDRFSNYSGEGFEVQGSQPGPNGAVQVTSQITRPNGGPPIHIEWLVAQEQGGPKIIDVVVEGVSMTVTQRQEFASIISQNGGNVQALIDMLAQRTGAS